MLTVEAMQLEDLDAVHSIEEDSFSVPWTRESLRKELTDNKHAIYITAKENGKVLGYAGLWHVVTEGHITNIAVKAGCRRRGIGDTLLKELEKIARAKEMMGLTLEVRVGNEQAMRLYAKNGFEIEGIRKNYYPDTKEDAVIMWKYL